MWYLENVETGVALSSENDFCFVMYCVFMDDSRVSECTACIYACINVFVYVKPILTNSKRRRYSSFSRPRTLFKDLILRFIEPIDQC